MKELLGQNNPDEMQLNGSATFDFHRSPFSDSGNFSAMSPYNPVSRTSASFTPHTASSPIIKKSKLSISTSNAKLNNSMSRSVRGIALRNQSPKKSQNNTPHASNAAHMVFPNFDSSMGHSKMLSTSRSAYLSTSTNLGDFFAGAGNLDPAEAKSLYFAHYNGLEVSLTCSKHSL